MTFDASPYSAHLLKIRYVDLPRDAVPVRRRGRALRRVAIVTTAAATLLVAAIGFAEAARIAPDRVIDSGPVPGEFRLGPGNQQPPGYGVPARRPVPGEFRLGPGNQQPPGYGVPLSARRPVPGEFRLGPGNQQPPGVVVPLGGARGSGAIPGEFRLGPGNQEPPGVVVPLG